MANDARLRLILHGAIVLLVGMLCGLPTAVESMGRESVRYWHTVHEALIMIGIWRSRRSKCVRAGRHAVTAFVAAVVGILGTVVSAALTLMSARAALQAGRAG